MQCIHFLLALITIANAANENNVCKTIKDYYTMANNSNCWFDSTVGASVPEIIRRSGRRVLEYNATTQDGYIIRLFRIPNTNSANKKKDPVFLQHGLMATSADWVSLGKDSFAFQLSDRGYDVWLGNYRGSEYSEGHVKYSVNDDQYWDHTVDEVAMYDIPACLNLISSVTGSKGNIIYIGHSLGCTLALVYASERPDEAKSYMKLIILTAPAYNLAHMKSPARYLLPFIGTVLNTVEYLGLTKLASSVKTTRGIAKLICLDTPQMMEQCINVWLTTGGPQTSMAADKWPLYMNQHPGGTSIKLFKHVSDFYGPYFRKYDYGYRNMEIYGSNTPPSYDVSRIKVPIYVIHSKNDWLTVKEDVLNLYRKLPAAYKIGIYEIEEENFNHIDYLYSPISKHLYMDHVFNLLKKYSN